MVAIQSNLTQLLSDNQSYMAIAKNPIFHACTKHIEIQYHFIRDLIMDEEVDLVYYLTTENATDIFTKALEETCLRGIFINLALGQKSSSLASGH